MTKLATFMDDAEADVLTGVLTGGFRNRPNSTTRRSSRRHERGGNPVNGPAQTAHTASVGFRPSGRNLREADAPDRAPAGQAETR